MKLYKFIRLNIILFTVLNNIFAIEEISDEIAKRIDSAPYKIMNADDIVISRPTNISTQLLDDIDLLAKLYQEEYKNNSLSKESQSLLKKYYNDMIDRVIIDNAIINEHDWHSLAEYIKINSEKDEYRPSLQQAKKIFTLNMNSIRNNLEILDLIQSLSIKSISFIFYQVAYWTDWLYYGKLAKSKNTIDNSIEDSLYTIFSDKIWRLFFNAKQQYQVYDYHKDEYIGEDLISNNFKTYYQIKNCASHLPLAFLFRNLDRGIFPFSAWNYGYFKGVLLIGFDSHPTNFAHGGFFAHPDLNHTVKSIPKCLELPQCSLICWLKHELTHIEFCLSCINPEMGQNSFIYTTQEERDTAILERHKLFKEQAKIYCYLQEYFKILINTNENDIHREYCNYVLFFMIHELYQKQFFKHESILFLLKSISEHHIIEEYLWDKYAKATSEEDKDIAYRKIIINKIDYALIAQPNFYNKLLSKEIISIEELQIALKDSWKILLQHWNKAIENYDKNLLCNISSD